MLRKRESDGTRITVGLIGAGKFGSMFLAQARTTPGIHVVAVADLSGERARKSLLDTGWEKANFSARSFAEARKSGTIHITEDSEDLIKSGGAEVIIEATGDPVTGIRHALSCFEHGRHVVMVNVEADALLGPLLARRAERAGVVYSMAYGDQPAIICEMVDWARATGFEVVCAGKGTKYLPEYHASTPETVWEYYGLSDEEAEAGGMNPKMFNSFLDGTKSAIEMAAVANAADLTAPTDGLGFPPAGAGDLADVCIPRDAGGSLSDSGTVEVVSSLRRDGSEVERDLRWGVFVTFRATSEYAARCFREYGLATDESGWYAAMYRPYHLIGLELGVSVATASLRGHATGYPTGFRADVMSVAKKDLRIGDTLDGEGGYTVYGKVAPAKHSIEQDALPIGLAQKLELRKNVKQGEIVRWSDVETEKTSDPVRLRREMVGDAGIETATPSL